MENAQTTNQTTENSTSTIDYEAEYKKVAAERDSYKAEAEKQKKIKDQYATENANYKKEKEAQMTEEEKKSKEHQELVEKNEQMEKELAQMKLERECLANNFTQEETKILVKANISIEGVKEIATMIKNKVEEAVKSAKAEFTKGSSQSLTGKGSTDNGESDFQKHQNNNKKTTNIVEF